MAWQAPKEDWGAQDGVSTDDLERIESNIKYLYDLVNAAKVLIAASIGSPALATDAFATLDDYIDTDKTTLAANLTAKGVVAAASETLAALCAKVANILLATGDAVAADVLKDKIFSTAAGNGLVGTMPVPVSQAVNFENTNGDTTISFTVPKGYWDGAKTIWYTMASLISANIKAGATIFNVPGNNNVIDTSSGDATAAQILAGKKAGVDGVMVTGTMPNLGNEEFTGWRRAVAGTQTIAGRIHLGIPIGAYLTAAPGGEVPANNLGVFCDDSDFIAGNIVKDKSFFGLVGTYDKTLAYGDVLGVGEIKLTQTLGTKNTKIGSNSETNTVACVGGTDNIGYFIYNNGTLVKYNYAVSGGGQVWTRTFSVAVSAISMCVDDNNDLFIIIGGALRKINLSTGVDTWTITDTNVINGVTNARLDNILFDADHLYIFNSVNGKVSKVHKSDGSIEWTSAVITNIVWLAKTIGTDGFLYFIEGTTVLKKMAISNAAITTIATLQYDVMTMRYFGGKLYCRQYDGSTYYVLRRFTLAGVLDKDSSIATRTLVVNKWGVFVDTGNYNVEYKLYDCDFNLLSTLYTVDTNMYDNTTAYGYTIYLASNGNLYGMYDSATRDEVDPTNYSTVRVQQQITSTINRP